MFIFIYQILQIDYQFEVKFYLKQLSTRVLDIYEFGDFDYENKINGTVDVLIMSAFFVVIECDCLILLSDCFVTVLENAPPFKICTEYCFFVFN